MYADRYSRRTKFDPGSMGLALALNGTIVIGLIAFAAPHFVRVPDKRLITYDVKLRQPPPPIDDKVIPETEHVAKTTPKTEPNVPDTVVKLTTPTDFDFPPAPPLPPGTGEGLGEPALEPIKLTPVVIGPQRDSRFAGNFQPDYPADERRAGHEGRVVISVLIGVDGRVKQVKRVSAASDSFFEATERRALQKWRFKPGTRDGVPIETWEEVGVRFVLNNE
ncbi:MAG: TonB family protein [Sphingomonas bacterium]